MMKFVLYIHGENHVEKCLQICCYIEQFCCKGKQRQRIRKLNIRANEIVKSLSLLPGFTIISNAMFRPPTLNWFALKIDLNYVNIWKTQQKDCKFGESL